jgi:hypothetical protein
MGIYDQTDYAPIEAGVYCAKLDNCTLDETKADPKISVTYKLNNGRTTWQNFTFKDTTVKWLSWQLGVTGAWARSKEICKDPDSFKEVARACLTALGEKIGTYYEVEITHREYNGKTYTDLKLERAMTNQEAKAFTEAANKAPKKIKNYADDIPTMNQNEEIPF